MLILIIFLDKVTPKDSKDNVEDGRLHNNNAGLTFKGLQDIDRKNNEFKKINVNVKVNMENKNEVNKGYIVDVPNKKVDESNDDRDNNTKCINNQVAQMKDVILNLFIKDTRCKGEESHETIHNEVVEIKDGTKHETVYASITPDYNPSFERILHTMKERKSRFDLNEIPGSHASKENKAGFYTNFFKGRYMEEKNLLNADYNVTTESSKKDQHQKSTNANKEELKNNSESKHFFFYFEVPPATNGSDVNKVHFNHSFANVSQELNGHIANETAASKENDVKIGGVNKTAEYPIGRHVIKMPVESRHFIKPNYNMSYNDSQYGRASTVKTQDDFYVVESGPFSENHIGNQSERGFGIIMPNVSSHPVSHCVFTRHDPGPIDVHILNKNNATCKKMFKS